MQSTLDISIYTFLGLFVGRLIVVLSDYCYAPTLSDKTSAPLYNKLTSLIPIASFFHNRYSIIVELLCALAFLVNILSFSNNLLLFAVVSLISINLLTIIVIEIEHQSTHDYAFLSLACLGVIYSFLKAAPYMNLIILPIVTFIIAWLIKHISELVLRREILGTNELRLFLVSGFLLTIETLPSFFILTAVYCIIVSTVMSRLFNTKIYSAYIIALCLSIYSVTIYPFDLLYYF